MFSLREKLSIVFKVSRPRFWFYVAGPFLVGYTAGAENIHDFYLPLFIFTFVYFLLPANIFIYGVNDLYDEDTDALNQKKEEKEIRVGAGNKKIVFYATLVSLVLSLPIVYVLDLFGGFMLSLFLLLGALYSMPPVRFKARPFFDFTSNIFYVLPGFLGFYLNAGVLPTWQVVLAAVFWALAMHLFSAIPDIDPDAKANVRTTAVYLGQKNSLFLCSFLWLLSWFFAFQSGVLGNYIYLFILYPILPILPILRSGINLEKMYWLYPYINMALGFILFFIAALKFI